MRYKLVLRCKYCMYIVILYICYLRLCRSSEGDLWVDGSERARKLNSSCHPHSLPSRTTIKHAEVLKDPPLLLLPHSPTTLWHLTHSDVQPNGARAKERQRRRKGWMEVFGGQSKRLMPNLISTDAWTFEVFPVPLKFLLFAYGRNKSESLKLKRDNGLSNS